MNNFGLISQVLRGYWMLLPEEVIANSIIVGNLLSGNHNLDISKSKLSATIPIAENVDGSNTPGFSQAKKNSTAIISMSGTMVKYGTECAYGTEEIAAMIKQAVNSGNISTIVFSLDSGGGSVDSIPPLAEAIEYSRSKGVPVVAFCDTCASACYWIASCCDRIVASNELSSRFGSIGVMCSFADAKPAYEQMGYKFHEIYSDFSDHKNESFNLALEGKYEMIKTEELNPLAQKFQETVKNNRPNLKAETPGVLSGKMFWAKQALEIGLIDDIGNIEKAVKLSREILTDYTISSYLKS